MVVVTIVIVVGGWFDCGCNERDNDKIDGGDRAD
jgi:hypothetical protein